MLESSNRDYVPSCGLDSRRLHTFGRVVQEEALKQLVLDGDLLC